MSSSAFEVVSDQAAWNRHYGRVVASSVLGSFHYMAAAAELVDRGVAEAAVLVDDDLTIFHPFIRRPAPFGSGFFDLTSAYDFGGFWFGTEDPTRQQRLLARFEQEFGIYAAQANIVCEFIRLHPFSAFPFSPTSEYALRLHQDNVVIPLQTTIGEVRRGYSQSRRNQVMQGIRSGLTLSLSDDLPEFLRLYYANLDRLEAAQEYYFAPSFLESVKPHCLIAYVHTPEGQIAAGHMLLVDGKTLFLFLSASNPEYWHLRPNDFSYDAIVQLAIEKGFERFHLGGGAESLHYYKRSFSRVTVPFHHARRVFLPDQYDELTRLHDEKFPANASSTYFPRYRSALRGLRATKGGP